MDYKQKYEYILERARIFIKRWNGIEATDSELVLQELKEIFPELKESEDEKIRKEIIQSIQDNMCVIHKDKCIAWLEKQVEKKVDKCEGCNNVKGYITCTDGDQYAHITEQKPADKVEPKSDLEKGKWYVCNTPRYRDFVVGKAYYCPKNGMLKPNENEMARYVARNCFHLWTIQDAKDGDVLVGSYDDCKKPWIGIFKCISKDRPTTQFDSYCFLNSSNHVFTTPLNNNFYNQCKGHTARYALPATQEQRDLLFQKMKEAGYEWDDEKKELKKIEQKHTWSEDDKLKMDTLIHVITNQKGSAIFEGLLPEELITWLKSIKQRMKGE